MPFCIVIGKPFYRGLQKFEVGDELDVTEHELRTFPNRFEEMAERRPRRGRPPRSGTTPAPADTAPEPESED